MQQHNLFKWQSSSLRWLQANSYVFFQAFKRAKEVADAELAQRKGPLKMASSDEIRRVLEAKTDLDCLQARQQFCFVMDVHACMLSVMTAAAYASTVTPRTVPYQQCLVCQIAACLVCQIAANHVLLPNHVLGCKGQNAFSLGKCMLVSPWTMHMRPLDCVGTNVCFVTFTAVTTCGKSHHRCFSCLLHVDHSIHSTLLLQVKAGVDALTIKRKYKELAVALHPDKCKVSRTQT